MAAVLGNNQVKLSNGKVVQAQQGGWYDGQQFWGGSLSAPGQINSQSNQVGAGQDVSAEVNRQTSVAAGLAPNANQDFINKQKAQGVAASGVQTGGSGVLPNMPAVTSAGGGAAMPTGTNVAPINLPELYKSLTQSAGVQDKQTKLSEAEKSFNSAVSNINDNPFLAEASRVGRQQKLQTDFNNNTAGLRNDIATAKADVETQLSLQTKQFDINSEQTKIALDQFDRLLGSGALNNASNEDVASLTRSTGLSSGIIQSAIQNNKTAGLKTSTSSFDDGTNEGFILYTVDPQGNIVNQSRVVTGTSSKKGSAYSADNAVNAFLNGFATKSTSKTATTSPDDLWGGL